MAIQICDQLSSIPPALPRSIHNNRPSCKVGGEAARCSVSRERREAMGGSGTIRGGDTIVCIRRRAARDVVTVDERALTLDLGGKTQSRRVCGRKQEA
jgi:hypothetical protein